MTAGKLQATIAGLALANAVLHFIAAASPMAGPLAAPLAGFGAANLAAAYFARRGRNGVIGAAVVCSAGLLAGGSNYLQNGGSALLPVMFAIDIAVLALAALRLSRRADA